MPRGARALLLGGAAAVVIAAVIVLATDQRRLAFTNGVAPRQAVATLTPGQRACQRRIPVIERFGLVAPATDTGGRPGPALGVSVLEHRSGGVIRVGRVPAGYRTRIDAPGAPATAEVGRVRSGRDIDVCLDNAGAAPVQLVGTSVTKSSQSDLEAGGRGQRPAGGNLQLIFLRERPISLLEELPAAFARAALFHPPVVGAWTFWLLAALVAVGVPLLLARALRSAWSAEPGDGRGRASGAPYP
ncbi:MAG: hypothetical protein ACJ76S_03755 [Solirubrobacteraceae bacterium]